MIVTYVLLITFASGWEAHIYSENKTECLKHLTRNVELNKDKIQSISCEQLKEPTEVSDAKSN